MNIDQDLLRLCIDKDRKAQFKLYKQCFSLLMNVCLRYKKNKEDATEILNQGFLKILNNLHTYKNNIPFEAWSRRIMINTIIDEYRKNKKGMEIIEYTDFQDSNYENNYFDFNDAEKNFKVEELEQILFQLPEMTQKVFNLYAIDGYAHKEIAEMVGISVGTSKWHVSTAREKVRMILLKRLNQKLKKAN